MYRPAVNTDNGSSTVVASGSSSSYSMTKDTVSCVAPLKESGVPVHGTKIKAQTNSHSPRHRKRKVSKSKGLTSASKKQK